jgi:Tat protein secretion system quality control protein TatD with DNase activity
LNAPERVKYIGKYIWDLLNIDEKELREQVEKNFFNLYTS